MKNVDKFRLS